MDCHSVRKKIRTENQQSGTAVFKFTTRHASDAFYHAKLSLRQFKDLVTESDLYYFSSQIFFKH